MYPRASIREQTGRALSKIEYAMAVVANFILIVMAFAVTIDTILRYVFASPLPSVLTITELYILPAFVFGSAAYVQTQRGNISVDVFRKEFTARQKHAVNLIAEIGAIIVFLPMSYLTFQNGLTRYRRGDVLTGIIPFPTSYTWFIISIGLIFLCVRLSRQFIVDLEVLAGAREPIEAGPTEERERLR